MIDLRPLAVALALAVPAAGCMSNSPDEYSWPAKDLPAPEGWIESGPFRCDDFEVLWETAKAQACKGSFRIDDDATSRSTCRVVTTWKTDLAVSKNAGKRRRRFVDFVEQKDLKAGWKVRVSTMMQRNVDIDDPLNPVSAEWRSDAPDVDDAERVAYLIEAQFRDFGPSREFEMR